jgi:hypothetical protein
MEPKKLKIAVIREEYVAITNDHQLALVLNQFIYWSERIYDFDQFIEEENTNRLTTGKEALSLNHGWIYKTADKLADELMMKCDGKTIRTYCQKLVKMGYLAERNNPENKWDKKKQYRVIFRNVINDLHSSGYNLQGYKYDLENMFCNSESIRKNSASEEKNSESIRKNSASYRDYNKDYNSKDEYSFNKLKEYENEAMPHSTNNVFSDCDKNPVVENKTDIIKKQLRQNNDRMIKTDYPKTDYNQDVYNIANYWNTMENLTKHREEGTPYKKGLNAVSKVLEKHSKEDIMAAISVYNEVFIPENMNHTIVSPKGVGHKVGLAEFLLGFNNFTRKKMAESAVKLNISGSWFAEILKVGDVQTLLARWTKPHTVINQEVYDELKERIDRKITLAEDKALARGSYNLGQFYERHADLIDLNRESFLERVYKIMQNKKIGMTPHVFVQGWFYDTLYAHFKPKVEIEEPDDVILDMSPVYDRDKMPLCDVE